MSGDIVERLRLEIEYDNDEPNGPREITYGRVFEEAAAEIEQLRALVEQAFRDGIAYASNCRVDSVDLAWEQSRARETLAQIGRGK